MTEEITRTGELAKAYEPQAVEGRLYEFWRSKGVFSAKPDAGKKPYCITIPPPNVTGSLHMGHALNNSVLDCMTRWHRMRGFAALCLPGTDHAGIATQNVVERELLRQGTSRQQIGREAFIQRCWEWRDQYGNRIYHQLERLGCSYDWERVRFTMDPTYVDAIMEEFKRWYERGLIYRGTRVVNWDVRYQSAVSDIEVVMETRAGKLYHFRYPFADGSGYVTVATTRPETMLGDSAVAANPADERYQPLFGALIKLPLTDRVIPLIADDYAKPEFGSGAVKVTPAHDLDDFECGLRHNLAQIIVIGKDGKMTAEAGPAYEGLDRTEARRKVVEDMDALGLLEKIEDYTIQTPISDRSGEVIEPLLSEQWFVDMKPLAAPAIDAAKDGRIQFVPERYKAIYLHWMENIRDWCISRQLWWGHRIPVWWTDDGGTRRHAFGRTREEAVAALGTENCWQDEDVLDTWFSSALWPFATLGWPHESEDLKFWYPTSLLSTAQEILYLWVARMIMTGIDFIGEIPFHDVYVHATVLDGNGQRMSKSKGNGIDPIDLIEKYGADATRFSLLQQAGKNQDIRYSEQRTDIAGNFCNKLWNASRFVLMNLDSSVTGQLPPQEARTAADRWILHSLNETLKQVSASLATYDMDDATRAVHQFFWNDFCDWYVEMAKVRLRAEGEERANAQNMLAGVLETTLRMLHPFVPFITEELWQALPHQGETIALAIYPEYDTALEDTGAAASMQLIMSATRELRNLRAELGIAPGLRLAALAIPATAATREVLQNSAETISTLARLSGLGVVEQAPGRDQGLWVSSPIDGAEVFLEIGEGIDLEKELERVDREIASVNKEIDRASGMLANPNFVQRAKPEKVEEERTRLVAWTEKRDKLEARRKLLSGV